MKKRQQLAPNIRQKDGSGVPLMETMDFGKPKGDAITNVKAFLIAKHGEKEGMEKLRTMSGLKLLELAEELRGNKQEETGITKGEDGQEFYSMPRVKWN